MGKLQAQSSRELFWPAAEAERALYRDKNGDLRQNPVHLSVAAERMAFDGALGGRAEAELGVGAPTLSSAEAGLRTEAYTRLLEARDAAVREAQVNGDEEALVLAEQSFAREIEEARASMAQTSLAGMSPERRTSLATAAIGTMQGRRELLPGIQAALAERLRRAGIDAQPRPWDPSRAVHLLGTHPFAVGLLEPGSANPGYAAAEAAVASLAAHLIRQARQNQVAPPEVFLEVCPIDDYGDRQFGWGARLVTDLPRALQAAAPQGEEPAAGDPPGTPAIPRYRVFVVSGTNPVGVRVPKNPPLRHRGGARTVWSGFLTDAEAESLAAEVGKHAEVREVEFADVPKPVSEELGGVGIEAAQDPV